MKYSKSENEGKQNNKNLWRINKRHITMYTMIILPIGRTSGVLAVSGNTDMIPIVTNTDVESSHDSKID